MLPEHKEIINNTIQQARNIIRIETGYSISLVWELFSTPQEIERDIENVIQAARTATKTEGVSFNFSRKKDLVTCKQVICYLLRSRHHDKVSFPRIANLIQAKDHTTAMHNYDTAKNLIASKDFAFTTALSDTLELLNK
jgi:hypothetical protein